MKQRLAVASVFATVALAAAACSSSEEPTTEPADDTSMSESETSEPMDTPSEDMEEDMADPAAMLAGPGCAAYAEANPDGPASVGGMAEAPVSEAAAGNPLLGTLVDAVSGVINPEVNLVSTIDSDEFTIFAPVDDAFNALPPETLAAIATPEGAETLSTVLQYHVVPGRIDPADLVGTQTSVTGLPIEVAGTPDALTVNGTTNVICGGVQTANATVYLVDAVLMPPA